MHHLMRQRKVEIAAVSYCWAKPEHPDPGGQQLKTVASIITSRLRNRHMPLEDLAIFLDFGSLPQKPRSPEDQDRFDRGLKAVNLWYGHMLTCVWLLTRVLEGMKAYNERGWPVFEKA